LRVCDVVGSIYQALMSGVVLAARGRVVTGGDFEVEALCYPAAAPQRALGPAAAPAPAAAAPAAAAPPAAAAAPADAYVALVSGLCVGDPAASPPIRLSLMLEYLTAG
jgi:hypothetical protein